ncbi:MAG: hypothetical protein F4210_07345 [Holophagales bacterium]|nr:hypothetical protein [Holophagales bacterium]MYF95311.1 hypothetical protein [Holophagales bacterium]
MPNKRNTTLWRNTVVLSAGVVTLITLLNLSGGLARALRQLFVPVPTTVEVRATTPPHTTTASQTLVVDESNTESRVVLPGGNTKNYSISLRATDGFTIGSYEWTLEKAQRTKGPRIQIVDGGKRLSVRFSLNAAWKLWFIGGEKGHLKGTIVTHETRNVPKSVRVVGRVLLDGSGQHRLTEGSVTDRDSLSLRYSAADGGALEWSIRPGKEHVLEPCGVLRCAAVVVDTEDDAVVVRVRTFWRFFRSSAEAGSTTVARLENPRVHQARRSRFV